MSDDLAFLLSFVATSVGIFIGSYLFYYLYGIAGVFLYLVAVILLVRTQGGRL